MCFTVTDNYMFSVQFQITVHDSSSVNWQKWIKNETKLTNLKLQITAEILSSCYKKKTHALRF
jgi:hypothetical protein